VAGIPDYAVEAVRNWTAQQQANAAAIQNPQSHVSPSIVPQSAQIPWAVPVAPQEQNSPQQPRSWLQSGVSNVAASQTQAYDANQAEQAAQAAAQQPQIQEPQAAPPPDNGALPSLLAQAARGNVVYHPAGIAKVGEQWANTHPDAMPGDVPQALPNRYLPGIDDPTQDEVMQAKLLPGETSADLYNRLATEKAQQRAHPTLASKYEQEKTKLEEDQNEALLNRRFALSEAAQGADQAAIMATIQGRAHAQEAQRIASDQEKLRNTVDTRVAELDNLINQHSTASAANPVKGYYSGLGASGQFRMAIALGLGAFGQSMNGGQNVALDIMNKGIEGEIQKQRGIVDTLGTTIAAKRTLLGDMMSKFLSPQAAEIATRASLAGQAESELRKQSAQEKSTALKQQMDAEADQLAIQRDDAKKQALEAEHKTLMAWHPAQVTGQSGIDSLTKFLDKMGVQPKDKLKVMAAFATGGPDGASNAMRELGLGGNLPTSEAEVRAANFDLGRRVTIPARLGGGEAWDPTETRAAKAQEGLNSVDELLANNDRLMKVVMSGTRLSPDDRIVVDQIAAMNLGSWRTTLGLGVLSDSDKKTVAPLDGSSINDISLSDRQKMLENSSALIKQQAKKFMSSARSGPGVNAPPILRQFRTREVK